jgi:hypothetical protein
MQKRSLFVFLTPALAVALALTGAARLRADDGGGHRDDGGQIGDDGGGHHDDNDENEVKGALIAVDTTNKTVTISAASGNVILVVSDGTQIEINDHAASLAALADFLTQNPGARVEAEFVTLNGQSVATRIEVEAENPGDDEDESEVEVTGTLTAIDVNAGTITVEQAGGAGTLVLKVDSSTRIEVDDADLTLAQLAAIIPAGQTPPVKVEFDPSTNVAHKVEIELETEVDDDDVVMGVNPGSNTLVVRPTAARGRSVKLQLLTGTIITKGNRVVRLRQVRSGDHVQVESFLGRRGRRIAPRVDVTRSRR